jgi:hypothetical protein
MSSNDKLLPNDKINIEEENLKRVISWINTSDVKVAAILTFHIFLIGFLASRGSDIKQIWIQNQINNYSFPLVLSFFTYIFSTIYSVYYAFKALFPDITPRGEVSLFFFGTIPSLGIEKFKRNFKKITFDETEDDLLSQTFINAEIAGMKFKNVKQSIKALFIVGLAWVISLIMITILK